MAAIAFDRAYSLKEKELWKQPHCDCTHTWATQALECVHTHTRTHIYMRVRANTSKLQAHTSLLAQGTCACRHTHTCADAHARMNIYMHTHACMLTDTNTCWRIYMCRRTRMHPHPPTHTQYKHFGREVCIGQGSTQGTQIIWLDPEQPVKIFRVSRNCFYNYSGCYKFSRSGAVAPGPKRDVTSFQALKDSGRCWGLQFTNWKIC